MSAFTAKAGSSHSNVVYVAPPVPGDSVRLLFDEARVVMVGVCSWCRRSAPECECPEEWYAADFCPFQLGSSMPDRQWFQMMRRTRGRR